VFVLRVFRSKLDQWVSCFAQQAKQKSYGYSTIPAEKPTGKERESVVAQIHAMLTRVC